MRISAEAENFCLVLSRFLPDIGSAERDSITPVVGLTRVFPPMPADRSQQEILYLGKRKSGLPRKGFK